MIYFDNSATTRISEAALRTYVEVSESHFGNPSSLHALGADAEKQLNGTREAVCHALGTKDGTVIFTAGGSEANNLALFGRAHAKERYRRGGKILTTAGEHASVTSPLAALAAEGFAVEEIPTRGGKLDLAALEAALTPNVILVTMMMVNNETGALYPLGEVARLMKARAPEAILHVDATQSFLKLPFTAKGIGADMVTVSSHKIEGPKGVGALWVSPAVIKNKGLSPLILGGGQESGFRSGTENVPGIAAFGTAIREMETALSSHFETMTSLRDTLIRKLQSEPRFSEVSLTLPPVAAPHILNLTLPRIKSETMLHFLSAAGICVSSGSACSSNGQGHPSPALLAFGRSQDEADCSLRISFSYRNTPEEIDTFCDVLAEGLGRLARKK